MRWNNWHFRGGAKKRLNDVLDRVVGTHYIFSDDHINEVITDCLAPSGCIFLGGGDGSKKACGDPFVADWRQELIKMLINGEPVLNHRS